MLLHPLFQFAHPWRSAREADGAESEGRSNPVAPDSEVQGHGDCGDAAC